MAVMIGLEVHVQLNTASKLFCSDSSDLRGKKQNTNTCPICLGFPGSKPVLNKKALDLGMMVALALNCEISKKCFFSRKTYFYPDMSKNFQITQYEEPLAVGGAVSMNGTKIRIRRVHIEEDPAKLVHMGGDITTAKYVLIDYNRSGIPLAEIVTEPDFESPKQARLFLDKLLSILEHLGAYDSSKEASIRVDANISFDGGERVEVKNITGFENVEKALNFEIIRQKGLARMQVKVERETRHFDAERGNTVGLRKKEFEEDYGYIFDPDLPVISVGADWLSQIKRDMPELPDQRTPRFVSQYKIPEYAASVIVYTDKYLADFFEECCKLYNKPDRVANWTVNYLLKSLNWRSERIRDSKVKSATFVELLKLIDANKITERYAKELIKTYVDTGTDPRELIKHEKLLISESALKKAVEEVLKGNNGAVADFKAGKGEALQFLIGKVLVLTNKQADPNLIRKALLDALK
jgi:aspartyl-tRNA(Asn)/glutamyl-tRNA(Gln) amidotransferase subunit B